MRITRDGLLITALVFVLAFVSLAAMMLAANDLLSDAALLALEFAIIAAGVGLWKLLDRKRRREEGAEIAANEYQRRQARDVVPEPCQLCYTHAARVRCGEHKLDICIGCCARHDSGFRCTMYLLPPYEQAMKARI